jgi:hypothetical protein
MNAALTSRGTAVGILADSLEKSIRNPENRAAISRGDLCLVTPYSPSAPFSVGTAMGINKLIYPLLIMPLWWQVMRKRAVLGPARPRPLNRNGFQFLS